MPQLLIPRLHIITDDAVLARPDFLPLASQILQSLGQRVAVHVRGPGTPTQQLFAAAEQLSPHGCCFVNDRIDIALATGAAGVQLGARSVPPEVARPLLKPGMWLGRSVHSAAECDDVADFVIAGTIYPSSTHPNQPAQGIGLINACARFATVIGIGGVTLERVGALRATGAHGVAVIRAVWHASEPVQAAAEFARMLYERGNGGND